MYKKKGEFKNLHIVDARITAKNAKLSTQLAIAGELQRALLTGVAALFSPVV